MKKVAITLVRSAIGRTEKQKQAVLGLGLRKIGQTVIRPDSPEVRGMVKKIPHLLRIEERNS